MKVEEALHLLHSEDIVFADLQTNNILYVASDYRVLIGLVRIENPGIRLCSILMRLVQSGCAIYYVAHGLWPLDRLKDFYTKSSA